MSLRTISSTLTSTASIAVVITQLLSEANAQVPGISSSKPVLSEPLYVCSWPNGFSQVDTENSMNSGIVSNIDFSIVGPKLSINTLGATYCFIISGVTIARDVVTALQSYGLVDPSGFDKAWPSLLPPLHGPAAYTVVNDPVLPPPNASVRQAFDILHQYYQLHYLELVAQARARPTPTPTPSPGPPVTFKRIEDPSPPPGQH